MLAGANPARDRLPDLTRSNDDNSISHSYSFGALARSLSVASHRSLLEPVTTTTFRAMLLLMFNPSIG
jgi:hypothetical protein